jgi:multiple sugar transport system substrate-binding protein
MLFLQEPLRPRAARHGPAAVALAGLAVLALAAAGCLGTHERSDTTRNAGASEFTLTIAENAISGGKSAASADWITNWVIPEFIRDQRGKGRTARVIFQPSGAADEDYKTRVALDLKTRSGADIYSIDGIWIGELAEAGYIEPLERLVGKAALDAWEGWAQIPPAVKDNVSYEGKRYGLPSGTDGRVLYFNKKLFARAGLPTDWQPVSWDDLIAAGQRLKAQLPGVTPIQLNAGTAMGEATTMQGLLPLLAGAGRLIWEDGRWQGDTPAMRDALAMYERVYGTGLGDPVLQQDARGRDKSFQAFAAGKLAILLESDYFWRSVIEPAGGIAKMPDRNETVGYALIPARKPGGGIRGQDFVSMSGGGGHVLNPATRFPKQAWELLQFMSSKEATTALLAGGARITQRQDVNAAVLGGDPLLSFVAERVLPITAFRPGLAVYPRISQALQQATLDVVSGRTPAEAAAAYHRRIEPIVGGASRVASG